MAKRQSLKEMMIECGAMKKNSLSTGLYDATSYIDGQWISGGSMCTVVLNPTTGDTLGFARDCTHEQINLAFSASRIAQCYWSKENQHRLKNFSRKEIGILKKRQILDEFSHGLDEYRGELALLLDQEMGKVAISADADITESIHSVEYYRDIILKAMTGEFRDAQMTDKKALTKRFPYGTVLAIKPFNFIALYWWTALAAITAGNSVVIKASEDIPFVVNATVVLFHKAVEKVLGDRAKKIASLVQVIHGTGEVGNYAAQNGDYDMLSFTGGTKTAAKLRVICAERNKRIHVESGGHAAVIVLDDFDLKKAADEIVLGAFGDAGQRCTSTKVVFAQDTIAEELLELVIQRAKEMRIGDPTNVDTKIGPIINAEAYERICDKISLTIRQLGRGISFGGSDLKSELRIKIALEEGFNIGEELEPNPNSTFLTPTIFTDVPYGVHAMDEEIFGPVLVFNKVPGDNHKKVLENAIDLVNQSKYGLSSAILTNDARLLFWAFDHTHTGVWYGGRGTTGAEVPGYFSVVGESGDGYEAHGIELYSFVKQAWLDLYPETRLAQTGSEDEIKKALSKAKSLF